MKIAIIVGGTMGGTEKAACLFASELARRGHEVEALTPASGYRVTSLKNSGVRVLDLDSEKISYQEYIHTRRPDVIHNHTSGYAGNLDLYNALDAAGPMRPKLIETNVFGRLCDKYDKNHVAMRMFVSKSSGCQAFARPRDWKGLPSPNLHTVLYNPLPNEEVQDRKVARISRESLGINEDDFLLLRVGLPSHKWVPWECEAFHRAARNNSKLRLIVMEPPDKIRNSIENGKYGNGIIVLKATPDQAFIEDLYRMSDAMIHTSIFGESYGYTLAEGMRKGLPVITRTTPWADNAQVELVQQGTTGYVCCSVAGMARAIMECSASRETHRAMSETSRRHIADLSDLTRETDLLEEVFDFVTSGVRGPIMHERFAQWMAYRESGFSIAEWRVFEKEAGMKLPLIYGKAFSVYRQIGKSARTFASRLR